MMSVHTVGTIDQESCGKLKEMTQQIGRWQDGVLLWKCVLWYIQCFMTDSGRRDHRDHISAG